MGHGHQRMPCVRVGEAVEWVWPWVAVGVGGMRVAMHWRRQWTVAWLLDPLAPPASSVLSRCDNAAGGSNTAGAEPSMVCGTG